jgi:hypothetical protein
MNETESITRFAINGMRLVWRILAVIGLLVLLDLISSAGIRQFQRTRSESGMLEAELAQEPYRGSDWGRPYWEELGYYEVHWDPYYVHKVDDMHGRFINVVNGVRRTYQPPASSGDRCPIVFVFGGSAAWGHGVRDDATLPSWLARVAAEQGTPLEVRNYAESGWVNWQGIAYLLQLLADGERPAAVVFYSGVNEILSGRRWPTLRRPLLDGDVLPQAMTQVNDERHRPLTRAWTFYRNTSFLMSAMFGGYPVASIPTPSTKVLVPKIASEYSADRALVESLGKTYGFSALFVWQLTVADKQILSQQERTYAGWLPPSAESKPAVEWWSLPRNLKEEYEGVGREVIQRGAIGMPEAFDGMSDTAFIDWMHPTESGNERIARALYRRLAPQIPRQTQPTVTAYPAVTHGIGRAETTVAWATGDGTVAEVYVSIDGGPEILFAGQSTHGTQDADWIEAGAPYEFRLYAGTDHKRLLSRAFVTRLADGPGAVARSAGGSVTRQIVNVTLIAALVGCAGIAGRIAVLRNRQKAKNAGSTPD